MQVVETKILTQRQKEDILKLWNREYPVDLVYADMSEFEAYLQKLEEAHHYLVVDTEQAVMGWLACFTRDKERWFAMIMDSKIQGRGLGSGLLSLAKKLEKELNGWVIDKPAYKKSSGENYTSPIGFYIKNCFEVIADTRLETNIISAVKIRWRKEPTVSFGNEHATGI